MLFIISEDIRRYISIALSLYITILTYYIYKYIKIIPKLKSELNDKIDSIYLILQQLEYINNKIHDLEEEFNSIGDYIKFQELSGEYDNVTFEELEKVSMPNSKPIKCIISGFDIPESSLNWQRLLGYVLSLMSKENRKKSIFKIKNHKIEGWTWHENLGISVQRKNSRDTLFEILKLCECMKYNIYIQIELENNKIIRYAKSHFEY